MVGNVNSPEVQTNTARLSQTQLRLDGVSASQGLRLFCRSAGSRRSWLSRDKAPAAGDRLAPIKECKETSLGGKCRCISSGDCALCAERLAAGAAREQDVTPRCM